MRWLLVLLCACISTACASFMRCYHPRCEKHYADEFRPYSDLSFSVEGHNITARHKIEGVFYRTDEGFYLNCDGWPVLGTDAMPRFDNELRVAAVRLVKCPLPATGSLANALAAMNITLAPEDETLALMLAKLPPYPPLAPQHLRGLENLTLLAIFAHQDSPQLEPAADFLAAGFNSLRSVLLSGVKLPPRELHNLPATVEWLELANEYPDTLRNTLSETTTALPGLRCLELDDVQLNPYKFLEKTYLIGLQLCDRKGDSLNKLDVWFWDEKQLMAFEQCDGLQSVYFYDPRMEELPERWVAACGRLENITVQTARYLEQVPEKLLDGATALKRLTIHGSMISRLPYGFLKGAPNLIDLDLSMNRLHILKFDSLTGPALRSLSLSYNHLNNYAFEAIGYQTSLTYLTLTSNNFDGNICHKIDRYGPLHNMTHLKVLDLSYSDVKVCRDWKLYYPQVEIYSFVNYRHSNDFYTDW